MFIEQIAEHDEPSRVYQAIKTRQYPVWLDSAGEDKRYNHYSIIAADPIDSFLIDQAGQLYINGEMSAKNWAEALDAWLASYQTQAVSDLPFIGGAIGYISYDFKQMIEDLPSTAVRDTRLPLVCLRQYAWAYVYDHHAKRGYVVADQRSDLSLVMTLLKRSTSHEYTAKPFSSEPLQANVNRADYMAAIARVRDYIAAGDVYQINFTQRLHTPLTGDIDALYDQLRRENPAPFAAYLKWDDYAILSSSPERFIERRGDVIITRPIKGTIPRSVDKDVDRARAQTLQHSEKDRSELLMIVDLERNDLSKIAAKGSVVVPENFVIESYQTVHHLVSTVQATVRDNIRFSDVLKATFPGGSITGAPKIRAMQIIDELEPTARGIYTGAIGYIDRRGDFDFNIVIRTLFVQDGVVNYQVGGGIVWDSRPQAEYEECMAKGLALKRVIYHDQSLE